MRSVHPCMRQFLNLVINIYGNDIRFDSCVHNPGIRYLSDHLYTELIDRFDRARWLLPWYAPHPSDISRTCKLPTKTTSTATTCTTREPSINACATRQPWRVRPRPRTESRAWYITGNARRFEANPWSTAKMFEWSTVDACADVSLALWSLHSALRFAGARQSKLTRWTANSRGTTMRATSNRTGSLRAVTVHLYRFCNWFDTCIQWCFLVSYPPRPSVFCKRPASVVLTVLRLCLPLQYIFDVIRYFSGDMCWVCLLDRRSQ